VAKLARSLGINVKSSLVAAVSAVNDLVGGGRDVRRITSCHTRSVMVVAGVEGGW